MHLRVLMRSLVLIAALAIGVGGVVPAMPATAHSSSEPPFEIIFPQEADKTDFTNSFGDSRSGGRRHKGNDLLAPRMTEVYAVADGTVTYVGINNLSGRNVKLEHVDGWESYYLHLNNDNPGTDDGQAPWTLTVAPGVEVGKEVEAGQLIGWVGDSGNAEGTTPHTHFELRHDGVAINPYRLLVEAYARAVEYEEGIRLLTSLPDYEIE
ncbi:MAG: M23 family metallopeptidase [Actinomycetota bacterium]